MNAGTGCALNRMPIIQAILSRRGIAGPDNLTGEGSEHLRSSEAHSHLSRSGKELGQRLVTMLMQNVLA